MKKIHFIGIGGTGMSGLAKIFIEKGLDITGSDLNKSETVLFLENIGAKISIGQKPENVESDVDTVIYSTAIREDNKELKKAHEMGKKVWHRSQLLAHLTNELTTYGVAGAHGKTTTTTMLAEIFTKAKENPTISSGGKLIFEGANGKYDPEGEILIAELDESDGSFLRMKVDSAIITNIDDDHLDFYRTKAKIVEAFSKFITNVENTLVINGDDETLVELCHGQKNIVTFGGKGCDYTLEQIKVQNYRNTGKVYYRGLYIGTINIPLPGIHNLYNALGALALARSKNIPDDIIFKSLDTFEGVGRRFEIIGQKNGITIVDDYAHHPNEIKALLDGAKSFGFKRVIAVFQPHRYSRTKQLFKEFTKVLKAADIVVINSIYSAGENPIEGISGVSLAEVIGRKAKYIEDFADIVTFLKEEARSEDLIITIGAGDIWTVGEEVLKEI